MGFESALYQHFHLKIRVRFFLVLLFMKNTTALQSQLSKLEGTWYVNMSNFKMWLKGDKLNPKFIYSIKMNGDVVGLNDTVCYKKNNKDKTILGFDTPENETATKFTWRGKGLLFLFKSRWEIRFSNDQYTIIYFKKTIATDEGYDVISRQKKLDEATIASIKMKLKTLGINEMLTLIKQG